MPNDNIGFISCNVKGIQQSRKRIKVFEYCKNNFLPNGSVFSQETHSSIEDEKQWWDSFKGKIFYS